jgi:hypothetical protein
VPRECKELYDAAERAREVHFEAVNQYEAYRTSLALDSGPGVIPTLNREQVGEFDRLSDVYGTTMTAWLAAQQLWTRCASTRAP